MAFDLSVVQDGLWMLVQGLLALAIPILVHAALGWVSAKAAQLRGELSTEQNRLIDKVLELAIQAGQQLKAIGVLDGGAAAKAFVVDYAQKEFERMGIQLDVDVLADRVEGAYFGYKNGDYGYLDKETLLKEALNVAVMAYDASGTREEAIELVGAVAKKYLAQYGISLDVEVLDALVLAKLQQIVR